MMVPDDFIAAVAGAVHEYGGLFVLDCVASGTVFVNLEETGVDVLLTAPQKRVERVALRGAGDDVATCPRPP